MVVEGHAGESRGQSSSFFPVGLLVCCCYPSRRDITATPLLLDLVCPAPLLLLPPFIIFSSRALNFLTLNVNSSM